MGDMLRRECDDSMKTMFISIDSMSMYTSILRQQDEVSLNLYLNGDRIK